MLLQPFSEYNTYNNEWYRMRDTKKLFRWHYQKEMYKIEACWNYCSDVLPNIKLLNQLFKHIKANVFRSKNI